MRLQSAPTVIDADSAQRIIGAVFRQAEYQRSLRRTLIQQIFDWIRELIRAITAAIDATPNLQWVIPVAALLVVSLILARVVHLRRMGERRLSHESDHHHAAAARDPWLAAHAAARAGNYLEAAHTLYLAVLQAMERRDRIALDAAKTVGDYLRDLRRSDSGVLPLFREFAKVYQPVVWGSRDCDLARFEQLSGIASRLTGRSA